MTSGLETEWDYSGRKRRDGQKKKIGKINEKRNKEKVKIATDKKVNGQREKRGEGVPQPHTGHIRLKLAPNCQHTLKKQI